MKTKLALCLYFVLTGTSLAQIAVSVSPNPPGANIAISSTPTANGNFAWSYPSSSSYRKVGQTFTATSSVTSTQLAITLYMAGAQSGANGAAFHLALCTFANATATAPSTTVWSNKGTLPANLSSLTNQYLTFYLPTTTYTAGTVYGFLLSFDNPAASEQVNFSLHGGDTYSGGTLTYTSDGTTYPASGNDLIFYVQNAYQWPSVALSGAGAMVTSLYVIPGSANNVWIRTDVGGAYRFNSAVNGWNPLTDTFPLDWAEYYACDSLAIDPANLNTIYYAGGVNHGYAGAILKSTDNGFTWTMVLAPQTTGTPGAFNVPGAINGGTTNRWAGERMAVSPFNSNIVLYGSRTMGMWRSTDAGSSWTQVSSSYIPLPPSPDPLPSDDFGVQCITFDPTTSGKVYAAVSEKGVYMSTDSGATWSSIGGGTKPERLKVAPSGGTVWYTTETDIEKYTGGWSTFMPGTTAGGSYCGLVVDPVNTSDIIVQQGAQGPAMGILWRSQDNGGTWNSMPYSLTSSATWANPPWRFSPSDLAFDPIDNTKMWGGIWHVKALDNSTPWVQEEKNHEENVMLCLACPPTGHELFEGSADDQGFAWDSTNLRTYPSVHLADDNGSNWTSNIKRIVYCESDLTKMMRTSSQQYYGGTSLRVYTSSNSGNLWNAITFPSNLYPMDLAMSATNSSNAVAVCGYYYSSDTTGKTWVPTVASNTGQYTNDFGAHWNAITGLPAGPKVQPCFQSCQILAADHVNGSNYYYLDVTGPYSVTSGSVYRSTDGGKTFSQSFSSSTLFANMSHYMIKTRPGQASDVWISADKFPSMNRVAAEGLYHSTDGGVTFNRVTTVTRAVSFGFGAPPSGSSTPALYLYGRITGDTTEGVYCSTDLGVNWSNISDPVEHMSDAPLYMEGSRQTFGRVFIGTGGRGIFYSTLTSQ